MFLLFLCRAAAALALSQWDFIEILSGIDMYAMRLELRVIKIIVSITLFCSSAIPQPHLKLPIHFHCCVGGWVGGCLKFFGYMSVRSPCWHMSSSRHSYQFKVAVRHHGTMCAMFAILAMCFELGIKF